MILVAGGTGTLGQHVVRLLADAGEQVRVLTREAGRAGRLPASVEVVTGDVQRQADVAAAIAGCNAVVSAVHGFVGPGNPSPEAVDRDGNAALIRASRKAGVERFVLLSVVGARPDHPMSLFCAKHEAEQELRKSGLPFTIVRATAFMETWVSIIGGPLEGKGHALVFGAGTNPINFVSVRDVAAVVASCARDGSAVDEVVELGGPENLGFAAVAERLVRANGGGRVKHIPLPALRMMSFLARPFSPVFARQAKAAVVMNTLDLTFDASLLHGRPLPTTTLDDVIGQTRRA